MKRYLITGGAGFIGAAITNKLAKQGNFIRVLDNGSRGSQKSILPSKNVEYCQADIRDSNSVEKACKNVDAIIHLAFINGTKYFYEKPDLVLDVGVKGMLNILDAGEKQKVKELFLASSSEVYQTPPVIPTPENVPYLIPDPLNPRYSYAGGKIISEMLSLFKGSKIFKNVVIFRPHNVYGPNMGTEHVIPELIKKILIEKKRNAKKIILPIQGDGTDTRAFIYIEDFVEGLMVLLQKGKSGEIYNIGTSQEISIHALISALAKASNTKIAIKKGISPQGSTKRRCPDIKKISLLGFSPKISIEEGLKKTYMWYNNNLLV